MIGQPDLTSVVAGKAPTSTDIGNPTAVAFDSKGDLWVSDSTNNRVLEYTPPLTTGEAASIVIGQTSLSGTGYSSPAGSLFGPTGLAFDSSGHLWVVDSGDNRILRFNAPFKDGENASLVLGQPTFGGYIGQTTKDGLNSPAYIAFDPASPASGSLWVTDEGNNRVLEYTAPFSTGQKASIVVGQYNFTSSNPGSGNINLFGPQGIQFDSKGNLWVADAANHRIQEYPFYSLIGSGQAASVSLGTSTTSRVAGVYAIAFDGSGNLWVSDGINGVGEYVAPVLPGEGIIQVIGGPKSTSTTSTTTATAGSALRGPQGIAFDSSGNLWVADYNHGRVLEFSSGVVSTSTSSSSSTTTTSTSSVVPVFPYQFLVATMFTLLLMASYVLLRRRATATRRSSKLDSPRSRSHK